MNTMIESALAQALSASDVFTRALGRQGLLTLTLVSSWLSHLARDAFVRRFTFYVSRERAVSRVTFSKYRVMRLDVDGFFDVWLPQGVASLTHLTLRGLSAFNGEPLTNLAYLTFGDDFNGPVDELPPRLIHLELGKNFNRSMDALPSSLVGLRIRDEGVFNQPIDHLPPNLGTLRLGRSFDQPVDHLPTKLRELSVPTPGEFDRAVDHLPTGLRQLQLGRRFNQSLDNLPSQLVTLVTYGPSDQSVDHLPPGLTALTWTCSVSRSIDYLPLTLRWLVIWGAFNHPIDHLPISLTHLVVGRLFDHPVDHLPPNLTHLTLGPHFNQSISHLPTSLTHFGCGPALSLQSLRALPLSVWAVWVPFPGDVPPETLAPHVQVVRGDGPFPTSAWYLGLVRDNSVAGPTIHLAGPSEKKRKITEG